MQKAFEIAKDSGYTEAVLFNSDSHQESRGFYKYLGFVEAGAAAAPDGEMGQVFSTLL
jgi:L-amino acid N-acyltransferase YncA